MFNEYTKAGLDAAEAREKAIQAVTDAEIAKETAEVTREEMLAIIREQTQNGDLAPEIAQARQGKATLGDNLNSIKSELAQTIKKLPKPIKYGEIKLPDDFPRELPFKIYWTKQGFRHDFDIRDYYYEDKIYVSQSGSSFNTGLTPDSPVREWRNVVDIANEIDSNDIQVVFLDKFISISFLTFGGDVMTVNKNISITSANDGGTFISSLAINLNWSDDNGLFKTTRSSASHVVNYDKRDVWGNPSELQEVESVNDCRDTLNSWYTDGSDVWINVDYDLEDFVDNIGVLYSVGINPSFVIEGDNTFVIDNVGFLTPANSNYRNNALRVDGTDESLLILNGNCFKYANSNGLTTRGVGTVYNFNTQAEKNLVDGLNYHGNKSTFIFEFECYGADNGTPAEASANATTAHGGMTILRIGTIGERCYGHVLADVGGCYSYNIGCGMYDALNAGSFNYMFSDTGAEVPGTSYLIDCDADGEDNVSIGGLPENPIYVRNFRGESKSSRIELEYI